MINARHNEHNDFLAWMNAVGISWNKLALSVSLGDSPGFGHVRALKALKEGDLLCTVPKNAILSIKTTACRNVLEKEYLGGGLGLTVAVMYEQALGGESKWHGYLKSLPNREYLPFLWRQVEVAKLQGTDLESSVTADSMDTREDFEAHVMKLASKLRVLKSLWTLERFQWAATLVASRAFYVDEFHGMSMVPLADLFNHKAAVVRLSDAYEIAEQADEKSDEEEDEGSSNVDEEGEEEEGRLSHDELVLEGEVTEPALLGNSPTARESMHQAALPLLNKEQLQVTSSSSSRDYDNGINLRLEIAICDSSRNGVDLLEITAASEIQEGSEVHNTYGEHSNADLVKKYGFALRRNPFNEVSLDVTSVIHAAEVAMSTTVSTSRANRSGNSNNRGTSCFLMSSLNRTFRRRLRWLSSQSCILDGTDPLLVMPGACISSPLLLLLHVLLAPEEVMQDWKNLEDAMDHALQGYLHPEDKDKHIRPQGMSETEVVVEETEMKANPILVSSTSKESATALSGFGDEAFKHAVSVHMLPPSTRTVVFCTTLKEAVHCRLQRYTENVDTVRLEFEKLLAASPSRIIVSEQNMGPHATSNRITRSCTKLLGKQGVKMTEEKMGDVFAEGRESSSRRCHKKLRLDSQLCLSSSRIVLERDDEQVRTSLLEEWKASLAACTLSLTEQEDLNCLLLLLQGLISAAIPALD
ncbi:hypothetical protein CEUSTIGMA_g6708.t1 [Chlamydomonas eustigma]|uniref:Uncharacterized protein n=1 Tax=Chlamydomonas eustigma TaxID=1157962 RepID=A0A250X859_9CHLO|nr:hypothetical protein CEUSTIGMA_g6708.t1 [Chlamydomonas eustigma]|eukprot:GAX79268.1 hypothetical protein CEUSTIGMA_g6708.t1 [Chlamydomonas eustigma]